MKIKLLDGVKKLANKMAHERDKIIMGKFTRQWNDGFLLEFDEFKEFKETRPAPKRKGWLRGSEKKPKATV